LTEGYDGIFRFSVGVARFINGISGLLLCEQVLISLPPVEFCEALTFLVYAVLAVVVRDNDFS
jgi:hypothetical protein